MVLRCLESLSTDQLVTLDTTRNATFGPVVDGVELTDTPHSLLRQGKIDPQLRAVMVGSTGEDSGAALEHNASSDDFRQFMAGEYLFKDYPKINQTLDRLVALYGAHDGRHRSSRPGSHPLGCRCPPATSRSRDGTGRQSTPWPMPSCSAPLKWLLGSSHGATSARSSSSGGTPRWR